MSTAPTQPAGPRLLYATYGRQSGVIEAVTGRLRALGLGVELLDMSERFLYKRHWRGRQVPNLRWDVALASLEAMRRYGPNWKHYYFHSCFAFDRMSAIVAGEASRVRPALILQSGCLFGLSPSSPTYLYVDHTRAIAERYEPVEGELPAIPADPKWRVKETSAYRAARGIFVMSQHVKGSLMRDYAVSPSAIHVVGAGPNVEPGPDFRAPAERGPAFLFVGIRFVPKGGPMLLEAFVRVRAAHPKAELWVVSSNPPSEVPPGVRLFGLMKKEELRGLYERASCFVLPTLREAFGLSYLEAMSYALPCIGPAIEAIPEIIDHGRSGLLIKPRDVDGLAAAMRVMLDHPLEARAMGEAGRRRVLSYFGWQRAVEGILAVLAPHLQSQAQQVRSQRS